MSIENIPMEPNVDNKPVSAYALFFRDTQAAIKGQNPNASFGEVSKIVASMWDALDSDHKNVYKKKTEAAKKEYLKALAAYRASLVSKSAGEPEGGMYGNYGNFNNQYSGYSPQNALPSPPMGGGAPTPPAQQPPQQQQPNQQVGQMKKPAMMPMNGQQQAPQQQQPPPQQHQGMMGSPMGPMGHMAGHMQTHMQQQGYMQHQQLPSISRHNSTPSPHQQEHPPNNNPPYSPHHNNNLWEQQQQHLHQQQHNSSNNTNSRVVWDNNNSNNRESSSNSPIHQQQQVHPGPLTPAYGTAAPTLPSPTPSGRTSIAAMNVSSATAGMYSAPGWHPIRTNLRTSPP